MNTFDILIRSNQNRGHVLSARLAEKGFKVAYCDSSFQADQSSVQIIDNPNENLKEHSSAQINIEINESKAETASWFLGVFPQTLDFVEYEYLSQTHTLYQCDQGMVWVTPQGPLELGQPSLKEIFKRSGFSESLYLALDAQNENKDYFSHFNNQDNGKFDIKPNLNLNLSAKSFLQLLASLNLGFFATKEELNRIGLVTSKIQTFMIPYLKNFDLKKYFNGKNILYLSHNEQPTFESGAWKIQLSDGSAYNFLSVIDLNNISLNELPSGGLKNKSQVGLSTKTGSKLSSPVGSKIFSKIGFNKSTTNRVDGFWLSFRVNVSNLWTTMPYFPIWSLWCEDPDAAPILNQMFIFIKDFSDNNYAYVFFKDDAENANQDWYEQIQIQIIETFNKKIMNSKITLVENSMVKEAVLKKDCLFKSSGLDLNYKFNKGYYSVRTDMDMFIDWNGRFVLEKKLANQVEKWVAKKREAINFKKTLNNKG